MMSRYAWLKPVTPVLSKITAVTTSSFPLLQKPSNCIEINSDRADLVGSWYFHQNASSNRISKSKIRILVAPGMGDIHWVMLKMESFLAMHHAEAEVWILNFDKRPRSWEFIQRIPFVKTGYYINVDQDRLGEDFKAAYDFGRQDIIPNFMGFDYFLCFNGSLCVGRSLEKDILPLCAINWNYPILETEDDKAYYEEHYAKYAPYVLFYFSSFGIFEYWRDQLPALRLRDFLRQARMMFPDHTLLLTGSSWDADFNAEIGEDFAVNLVGKTPLGPFLSLIRRATAFVGYPGGNTIVSTHFGTPTLMIWAKPYPNLAFRWNWVDPAKKDTVYATMEAETFNEDMALQLLRTITNLRRGSHGALAPVKEAPPPLEPSNSM